MKPLPPLALFVLTSPALAQSTYEDLELTLQNQAGVNLDEEVANMNLYQQSYEAGAHVLSTLQEMFDTLIGMLN